MIHCKDWIACAHCTQPNKSQQLYFSANFLVSFLRAQTSFNKLYSLHSMQDNTMYPHCSNECTPICISHYVIQCHSVIHQPRHLSMVPLFVLFAIQSMKTMPSTLYSATVLTLHWPYMGYVYTRWHHQFIHVCIVAILTSPTQSKPNSITLQKEYSSTQNSNTISQVQGTQPAKSQQNTLLEFDGTGKVIVNTARSCYWRGDLCIHVVRGKW